MKYIVTWNAGHGDSSQEVEADSLEEANRIAYEIAREEFENNSTYDAVEWSEENAEVLL